MASLQKKIRLNVVRTFHPVDTARRLFNFICEGLFADSHVVCGHCYAVCPLGTKKLYFNEVGKLFKGHFLPPVFEPLRETVRHEM